MNESIQKKCIFLMFLFIIPFIISSCKSNKKEEEDVIEYIEYGLDYWNSDAPCDPHESITEYCRTGVRVKTINKAVKDIEVYYGFIFDMGNGFHITPDSDLEQIVKFTLYRKVYKYNYPAAEKEEKICSFTNKLGWFYSESFGFISEDNKVIDIISTDDLAYDSENKGKIHYYYELTPIDKGYIDLFMFEGDSGSPFSILDYSSTGTRVLYDRPSSIKCTGWCSFSVRQIDGVIKINN